MLPQARPLAFLASAGVGSLGGASPVMNPYLIELNQAPAPNRRPPSPLGAQDEFACLFSAPPASPAAVVRRDRYMRSTRSGSLAILCVLLLGAPNGWTQPKELPVSDQSAAPIGTYVPAQRPVIWDPFSPPPTNNVALFTLRLETNGTVLCANRRRAAAGGGRRPREASTADRSCERDLALGWEKAGVSTQTRGLQVLHKEPAS